MTCKRGAIEGERLKADALAVLTAHREAVIRQAQRALLMVLLENRWATVDDVRATVELPSGINPKVFGSVPGPLARAGIIRADGFSKTCRAVGHARPVTVWVLIDRAAALRWLRDHPDLSDPDEGEGATGSQTFLFPINSTNEPGAAVAAAAPGMEAYPP